MSDIQPDQLDRILSALAEQLAARATSMHLVVIGGSGLLAMGLGDRPTRDVDVVAVVGNGRLVTAQPFPPALDEAAGRVAVDFGLQANWLNPGPTALLEVGGLPEGFIDRVSTEDFGPAVGEDTQRARAI